MFCLYNCHCNKIKSSLNYYQMYRGNIPDILNWQVRFALKETVIGVYEYPKEWIVNQRHTENRSY